MFGWGRKKIRSATTVAGMVTEEEARRKILAGVAEPGMWTGRLELGSVGGEVRLPRGFRAREIEIARCPGFRGLPEELDVEDLQIRDCESFSVVPASARITNLTIERCPSLREIPAGLRLERGRIMECTALKILPVGVSCRWLSMPRSDLIAIGEGLSSASVDLSGSRRLMALPDLEASEVNLRGCTSLERLPGKLLAGTLDLRGCAALGWQEFAWVEVGRLDLGGCVQLTRLPDWLSVTEAIDLAGTGIRSIPRWLEGCRLLWRGVPVEERIIQHPETIRAEEVFAERNAQRRQVLLERMGWGRFLSEVRPDVLHEDHDPGGPRRLLSIPLSAEERLVLLSVTCPSTGRGYILRVPPWIEDCRGAAAWIAGFDRAADYEPVLET